MKHQRGVQFERLLQVRAPEALSDALDIAADRQVMSRSSYIRRALVDRLRADGIDPATAGVIAA